MINLVVGLICVIVGIFFIFVAKGMTNLTNRYRFSKVGYLILAQSICCFLKLWFTTGTINSILNIIQLLLAIVVFVVLFWKSKIRGSF